MYTKMNLFIIVFIFFVQFIIVLLSINILMPRIALSVGTNHNY